MLSYATKRMSKHELQVDESSTNHINRQYVSLCKILIKKWDIVVSGFPS